MFSHTNDKNLDDVKKILADLVVLKIFFIPIDENLRNNSKQYLVMKKYKTKYKTKIKEDVNWVKEGF